jgi:hypothetical protein
MERKRPERADQRLPGQFGLNKHEQRTQSPVGVQANGTPKIPYSGLPIHRAPLFLQGKIPLACPVSAP